MQTFFAVIVVVASMFAPEPRAADLEPTIERMEQAVLRGDGVGYLLEIDRTDPVFFTEQSAWARDLGQHTPVEFDIDIDGGGFDAHEDGSVTVPMAMVWRLDEGARERRVEFTGRFSKRDGAWRYAGETWTHVEAPGVVVLCEPGFGAEAVHIAAILPRVQARVHEILGVVVERPQQVKVYGRMEHLQQSIYLSYEEPIGGWNEPGEAIKMTADSGGSGRRLRTMLAHEYGHCASFELGPEATSMPWWVLEGVAEYCSSEVVGGGSRGDRQVARWARSGQLRAWHQLADFRGEAMNHVGHVYAQGHSMVRFVINEHGIETLRAWMRSMAGGASLESATLETMGLEFSALDEAWRASLAAD